ncbi:T9SS type A sorting domain-containing protein [candidate division KSB1 bacterium]|nr:T9SS type A sorting domain-containing protein [candidate division KSB1 bacterium]RQW09639.1 MAG: T9SS C-terminal target domain-containing protein [candidate division KSB1 bacterium]
MCKKHFYSSLTLLFLSPIIVFASGNAGQSLTFDGVDDIAIVPDNLLLDSLAQNYTIEAWVNFSTSANTPRIIDRAGVFSLYIDPTGGDHVEFFSYTNPTAVIKSAVLSSGVWHHVAVRRQKVGLYYVTAFFVDGLPGATSTSADLALAAGTTQLTLGNTLSPGSALAHPLHGKLDDVRLWKIARSDAEIAAYRGFTLSGIETGLLAVYELNDGSGQTFHDKSINSLSGTLGTDPLNVDVNDPVWGPSNAPVGLNLLSPNSGTLKIGEPLTITWVADPALIHVHLLFSVDNGTSWMYLAHTAANTGNFSTYVPGYPTTHAVFRVQDAGDEARFDDSDALITFSSVGSWQKMLTKEAEDATITKPMHINWDGHAFDCTFIYSSHNLSGIADLSVTVPNDGLYVLWARVRSKGGTRNSYFVSIDGGSEHVWDTAKNDRWNWEKISSRGATGIAGVSAEVDPVLFNLTAGQHTIRFRGREHYTRLDRIRLTNDLAAVYWDEPDEWIELVNPPDGEDGGWVVRGTDYQITWKSQNISDKVTIEFSKEDRFFTSPVLIVRGTDNDGAYLWHVPDDSVDDAFIRISDGNGGSCPLDQTWDAFSIINPPPQITLTAPAGGEKWNVSTVHNITWSSKYFNGTVSLAYSIDKGVSWTTIATNRPASGVFAWSVPNTPSDLCLVRVADSEDGVPMDVSDHVFSIVSITPPPSIDYALSFDGLNDFVSVANSASLNVAKKFTIEFWLKTDSPKQNYGRILEKGSWDEYYMAFYNSTGKMCGALRVTFEGGTKMDTPIGPSRTVVAANKWYHIAATYDGSVARLYVNGLLESSKATTASPRQLMGDLIIGAVKRPGYMENHLKGLLDELRIWNKDRSSTEITAAMCKTLQGNETGLVAYYTFNEGAGQVLGDLTSYQNHGRLGGAVAADDADPAWVVSDRPASVLTISEVVPLAKNSSQVDMQLPIEFQLEQNHPNPFNAGTTIAYDIPNVNETTMGVILTIYDIRGQLIRMLNGSSEPGSHQIFWDGADESGISASSGVYFYRLDAGSFSASKRMVMLK